MTFAPVTPVLQAAETDSMSGTSILFLAAITHDIFHNCGAVTNIRWETLSLAVEETTDKNSEESPMRMCQCGLQRDHFLNFSKARSILGKMIN